MASQLSGTGQPPGDLRPAQRLNPPDEDSKMEESTQWEELQARSDAQRTQISQLQDIVSQLSTELKALKLQGSTIPQPTIPTIPVDISKGASDATVATEAAITSGLAKELSKKVYEFPDSQRLTGPENFELWKQGLNIMFRALNLSGFTSNPTSIAHYSDQSLAMVLMLLRNSIGPGPQATIAWQTSPVEAYKLLVQRYSHSAEIQRDSLYREYHTLKFSGYSGSLADFNASFSNLISRLTLSGVIIQPIDQVNHYLQAMEKAFPQWAERQRSTIRTMRALGQGTEVLDLNFLMADLVEEQRNPASTTAKQMANRVFRGPKNQSKSRPKGSKLQSQGFKDSKDPKDPKSQGQKGVKKWKKGQNKSQNKGSEPSFACIAGSYNITSGQYSDTSDSSSEGSDIEEILPKSSLQVKQQATLKAKEDRPYKDSCSCNHSVFRDSLLYDTGSTDHIINSKKWFDRDYKPNDGSISPIYTGGGPLMPQGSGTAIFKVLVQKSPPRYLELRLRKALYIPQLNINLMSGIRHYKAGGYLDRYVLKGPTNSPIAVLDFEATGFFLQVQGHQSPRLHLTSYIHIAGRYCLANKLPTSRLVVELPSKPSNWKDSFTRIEESSDSESSIVGPNSSKSTIGPGSGAKEERPRVPIGPEPSSQVESKSRGRPTKRSRRSEEDPLGLGAPGNGGIGS
jgi:hypothetical protein